MSDQSANGRTARTVGTVVGFVLFASGAAVASFLGLMLAFVSDSCGVANECDTGLIAGGMFITGLGPWAVFAAGLVVAVVRARRGRRAVWVPWIGIAIAALVAVSGITLAFKGAGGGFWG